MRRAMNHTAEKRGEAPRAIDHLNTAVRSASRVGIADNGQNLNRNCVGHFEADDSVRVCW